MTAITARSMRTMSNSKRLWWQNSTLCGNSQSIQDLYIQPLAFMYSTQTHVQKWMSICSVIYLPEPPSVATLHRLMGVPTDVSSQRPSHDLKSKLLHRVAAMKKVVNGQMGAAKRRTNHECDRTVGRQPKFIPGHKVFESQRLLFALANMDSECIERYI